MTWTLLVVACWSNIALADPSRWDGTYQHSRRGGNELCPDTSAPVVISGGKFSIVWSFQGRGGKQLFRVGRIEGTVRDTGYAQFTAQLMEPFPCASMFHPACHRNVARTRGELSGASECRTDAGHP